MRIRGKSIVVCRCHIDFKVIVDYLSSCLLNVGFASLWFSRFRRRAGLGPVSRHFYVYNPSDPPLSYKCRGSVFDPEPRHCLGHKVGQLGIAEGEGA